MAFVYWSGNYWNANYWQGDYWQAVSNVGADVDAALPSLSLTAYTPQVAVDLWDYFSDDYFAPNYWQSAYWGESNVGGGSGTTVDQVSAGALSFTSFQTFAGLDQTIFPATEELTFTALATDAANDVTVTVALEELAFTSFNPNTDNAGYIEGDIDLSVFASSAFSFTDGVNVSLETLTLDVQSPVAVEEQGATAVSVQSTPGLTFSAFPVSAANPKNILPTTLSLTLTEYSPDAGFGQLAQATLETLSLNGIQASVIGVNRDFGELFVDTPQLSFTALQADVGGVNRIVPKPESTFVIDQIVNATATTDVPSNYLICDRTGFRVKVSEGLREEWDGTMVRAKSFEARHPQDFVRSRPSSLTGSKRPEQDDDFISELYPAGVTADDL